MQLSIHKSVQNDSIKVEIKGQSVLHLKEHQIFYFREYLKLHKKLKKKMHLIVKLTVYLWVQLRVHLKVH